MTALITRKQNRPGWTIDDIFSDIFHGPAMRTKSCCEFTPAVDIIENDDNISMTFQVPGMNKDDIKIRVEGDSLTVSGKRENNASEEKTNYVHREISYGEFSRAFNLPESVNKESVAARYENGLLEISLTKKEEVKPKEIEINVS